MKHLLRDLGEAVGRTVAGAVLTYQAVAIHFSDGTAIMLVAKRDWEDTVIEVEPAPDPCSGEVVPLGLCSVEEWNSAVDAKRADLNAKNADHERREYERLRAKFGGGA